MKDVLRRIRPPSLAPNTSGAFENWLKSDGAIQFFKDNTDDSSQKAKSITNKQSL